MIEFTEQCCLLADHLFLALAHGLHLSVSCRPCDHQLRFTSTILALTGVFLIFKFRHRWRHVTLWRHTRYVTIFKVVAFVKQPRETRTRINYPCGHTLRIVLDMSAFGCACRRKSICATALRPKFGTFSKRNLSLSDQKVKPPSTIRVDSLSNNCNICYIVFV